EHLRQPIVARAELCRAAGPGVGVVQPVKRVVRLGEIARGGREKRCFSQLLEHPAPFLSALGGALSVARQELDAGIRVAQAYPELNSAPALRLLFAHVGKNRSCLVEAAEHAERLGSDAPE